MESTCAKRCLAHIQKNLKIKNKKLKGKEDI